MRGSRAVLYLLCACCLRAQPSTPATRAGSIEAERADRLKLIQPERTTVLEARLREVIDRKLPQRFSYGFNGLRIKAGGMISGGGFALGPEYFREDLANGALTTRASYQISTRNYHRATAQLLAPRLARGRLYAEALALYHNYGSVQYYGPGPDSAKSGRSNYTLEDTAADGSLGVRPHKALLLGVSGGHLWVNTGPGREKRFASADELYPPAASPGIDTQSRFWRYGVFSQLQYLDSEASPRRGGNYIFQYNRYDDRLYRAYGFNRIEADLRQYLPLFNDRRVFALRARTILTDTRGGELTPFYLQPVLGGGDDLRGFRPYRFRDRNMVVFNGEYRWEIFAGLDGAVFADAGKVFHRRGQLNFSNLESNVGFGFRANVQNRTFLRIDFAFSHEGFNLWIKFNDLFGGRTLGTSSTQPFL